MATLKLQHLVSLQQVLDLPDSYHKQCGKQLFAQKIPVEEALPYFADFSPPGPGARDKDLVGVVASFCSKLQHWSLGTVENVVYITIHDPETGVLITNGTRNVDTWNNRVTAWTNKTTPPAAKNRPQVAPPNV